MKQKPALGVPVLIFFKIEKPTLGVPTIDIFLKAGVVNAGHCHLYPTSLVIFLKPDLEFGFFFSNELLPYKTPYSKYISNI